MRAAKSKHFRAKHMNLQWNTSTAGHLQGEGVFLPKPLREKQCLPDISYAKKTIVRTRDIVPGQKKMLLASGLLCPVIKGWYVATGPEIAPKGKEWWHGIFWKFCVEYLEARFEEDWCLSPEQSVSLHASNWSVPDRLTIRSPYGKNNCVELPFNTSIQDVCMSLPEKSDRTIVNGLRMLSLEAALIACAPQYFLSHADDLRIALRLINNPMRLRRRLIKGNHARKAGYLAAAFRMIGRTDWADTIVKR
jgi:hypothetical protein